MVRAIISEVMTRDTRNLIDLKVYPQCPQHCDRRIILFFRGRWIGLHDWVERLGIAVFYTILRILSQYALVTGETIGIGTIGFNHQSMMFERFAVEHSMRQNDQHYHRY